MKVIIVGGVAGGASAAARLRRLDEFAQITVYERSGYMSYANCGLPYYVGGVITDQKELTLQTPESFYARFQVEVKVRHEVTAIDPANKTVTVKNLASGEEFTDSYDKLILSPGAKPTVPPLAGIDSERVFTLRTVEDTLRIKEFIDEKQPKSAVLAGGGFISLEMAENLRGLGIEVTLVQRPDQVLPTLDRDMAAQIHGLLRKNGVALKLSSSVEGFRTEGDQVVTLIKDDEPLRSDMVLLAIGVTPDTALANTAGIALGQKGAIVVNSRMETSVPHIYAVGDAVEVHHYVTGNKAVISLAGPANKQGRIAADNICGCHSHYQGSQGSSVLKLFDMTIASTGINEKTAKAAGIDYDKIVLSPASHAGYYPGGKVMTMKVVYEKETLRLLGAQIIGSDGVDKRIDVLATAIHCGMGADELGELDLAYAPPFSSAKDPVNLAGFMVQNLSTGKVKQVHWHDLPEDRENCSMTLLDTRTNKEYEKGHAEGFKHIPLHELRDRIDELDPSKPVYVMCQSGLRSYIASRILTQRGFDTYNFSGGYRFYDIVNSDRLACQEAFPCGIEK